MTTNFEVRVEGELTAPTLHRLGCAHSVAKPQTLLRIEATPAGLERVLEECFERGLTVEGVVRLDLRPGSELSRDRARAPGGPRRLDG
jgi:hypothetical protein